MRYLHRQAKRRKNPRINVPESLAVVVLLENYYWPDEKPDLEAPRVAKYARGADYHRVTLSRLDQLAAYLRARARGWPTPTPTTARSPSGSSPSARASAGSARTPC